VRDYENQRCRAYLAHREKGGQHRRVPVHSRAGEALDAYLAAAAAIAPRLYRPPARARRARERRRQGSYDVDQVDELAREPPPPPG